LRKLLLLMGLSMLGVLLFASVAFAQSGVNLQEDSGDNVDPETGEVVGDDTPDCASSEDVLESGLCRPSGSSSASATPSATPSATATATASPSTTPSASPTATATATATASASALPATGGPVSLMALAPLALLAGGGLLALRIVRRR
jgi:cytoskeletal protein RodZ